MSRVQRGHGGGQLILGEAGIGKSRLIEWLTNEARHRGQDIVVGRAWDAAHPTAMAPIQEALLQCRPLIDYAASHDAGPHLSLIGHLLPSRQGPLDPEPTPVLLAHAALASLDTAAPGTIVVIEDLHAADLETVAAVRHMLTHAGTTRILVIATARTTELTMDRWTGSDIGRITLERLAPDDIRALAAAQMDCDHDDLDVELMRRLELAEGLPLLAEDLIADTLDTGDVSDPLSAVPPAHALPGPSERFPDLVRRRLDMLDAHATILVQAAATLGPILELGVLADAVELDTRQLQNALAAAADAQLLSRDGSRFRHALTRDVVRAATPSFQRRAVAQRVAPALVDPPHHLSVECAELLVEAGARDRAASLLVRSARRERRVGANTSAASLLSRAREIAPEESPTALASVLLIEILIDLGRVRDAAAIALAERSTMPADDRIEVSLLLAAGAASAFDHEALDGHLSAAMSALADQDPRWPRAMTLDALRTLQFAGDLDRRRRAEAQAHEAVARAEAQGDRVALCDAWMVVGRCARFRDLDQGAAAYERAMDIATLDGLRRRRLDALQELGTIDLLTWRGPSRLEQARAEATAAGAFGTLLGTLLNLSGAYLIAGAWEQAKVSAVEARSLADELGVEHASAMATVWEASAIGFTGDVVTAERMLSAVVASNPSDLNLAKAVDVHARMGFALLDEDVDEVLRLAAIDRPESEMMDYGPGWTLLFGAKSGELDANDVRAALDGVAEGARPTALRCLDRCALAIAIGRTDPETASAIVDELIEHVETTGLATIMLRHVAEAALDHDWGAPKAWLSALQRQGGRLGTHHQLSAQVDRLLKRAGGKVPRRTSRAAHVPRELFAVGVTPREYELLARMASHPTNAELATAMHLSVRTVEKHVSSLLGKLGVEGRRGLAQLATEHGWTPVEDG